MIETLRLDIDRAALTSVPHLDQWDGLWMMEPSRLSFLASAIKSVDMASHLRRPFEAPTAADYRRDEDGVAVIAIEGTMQKHAASIGTSASTVLARQAIRSAAADDKVSSIMLRIESPGGTAAGTMELAGEVHAAKQRKPVHAHITDMGASAAFWVASQADRLTANPMAVVGSIGTYAVIEDLSEAAAKEGVKVHVIRAGDFKGIGTPGTEITAEQLAHLQETIEDRNRLFVRGVANGRRVDVATAQRWADGRVHVADKAKSLGLIDAVESAEESLSRLRNGGAAMPATATELRLKCPGCSQEFIDRCIADDTDVSDAQTLFIHDLQQQLTQERASMPGRIKEATAGVRPLKETAGPSTASSGSPVEDYWNEVKSFMADGMTRPQAITAVNRRMPELRQAAVAAAN